MVQDHRPGDAPGAGHARDRAATVIQSYARGMFDRERVQTIRNTQRPLTRTPSSTSPNASRQRWSGRNSGGGSSGGSIHKTTRDLIEVQQRERALENLDTVEAMRSAIKSTLGEGRFVIDPRTAEWTQWWDLLIVSLLLVVLFLTPYEVAFLQPSVDALFAVNRLFDLVFFGDMVSSAPLRPGA